LESNPNALSEHLLILYLISERPKNWEKKVDAYIASQDKNSLYLLNTLQQLEYLYQFDYVDEHDDRAMSRLIKKCLAKHRYSIENPVGKILEKIPDSALPKRELDDTAK
jgi:hypothetical protein